MARERQGMWLSGLPEVLNGLDNPLNQPTTDLYNIEPSNLTQSFKLQLQSQNLRDSVYNQQQRRHFQPNADSMSMWENIYNVLANNISKVGSSIRDMTKTEHNAAAIRPSVLYLDPFGNDVHLRNLSIINSKR